MYKPSLLDMLSYASVGEFVRSEQLPWWKRLFLTDAYLTRRDRILFARCRKKYTRGFRVLRNEMELDLFKRKFT